MINTYLAGQCSDWPLRVEGDGKLGPLTLSSMAGARNQSAGAMPQMCCPQPNPGVTFILGGLSEQ